MLLLILAARWVQTLVSLCLPVPSGCVAAFLMIGALIGRSFSAVVGESLCEVLECGNGASFEDVHHLGAAFAIIGATSFTSGTLHMLSIVISIFELISMPPLMLLSLSLAQIAAIATARNLVKAPGFFDLLLTMKKLPALPTTLANGQALLTVDHHMRKGDELLKVTLKRYSNVGELSRVRAVMNMDPNPPQIVPVVEHLHGVEAPIYVGAVLARDLSELLTPLGGASPSSSSQTLDIISLAGQKKLLISPLCIHPQATVMDAYLTIS